MRSARWEVAAATVVAAALPVAACGGADSPTEPTVTTPPANVRWEPYQGVWLPHADEGPKSMADGAATGFERTPPGAAVAAITHNIRLSIAPDDQYARVAAAEVVPGAARDEWATNRVQLSITGPAQPELAPRLLAYRIDDYSEDNAKVTVYTQYSDSSKAAVHTDVAWSGGDWRLQLPDPGSTTKPIESIGDVPSDVVKLEAPAK